MYNVNIQRMAFLLSGNYDEATEERSSEGTQLRRHEPGYESQGQKTA